MTCPGCSQENPAGARFCGGCGQPRLRWMSQAAIGRLHAARGRREEALGHYRAAWSIILGLRAGTQDRGLRAGLESSPPIREVEDLARPE